MSESTLDIILVDDNQFDAELASDVFRRSNLVHDLKVLSDGKIAVNYFLPQGEFISSGTCNHPCLVFLDLYLPKVHGLEVLRRIRESDRAKDIPVAVFITSQDDKDEIEDLHLGVTAYIKKGTDTNAFEKALIDVLKASAH